MVFSGGVWLAPRNQFLQHLLQVTVELPSYFGQLLVIGAFVGGIFLEAVLLEHVKHFLGEAVVLGEPLFAGEINSSHGVEHLDLDELIPGLDHAYLNMSTMSLRKDIAFLT